MAATTRRGSRARAASRIIDQPITQSTCSPMKLQVKLKVQPTVASVSSTTISHRPRLTRNRLSIRIVSICRLPPLIDN